MNTNEDSRIKKITGLLIDYAKGNFESRIAIEEEDDFLNTLLSGLNMLGEELSYYREQFKQQQKFTEDILNNIPAEIAVFDKHHRYLFISKAAVKNDELRAWLIDKDDFDYCALKGISPLLAKRRRMYFKTTLSTKQGVEWMEEHNANGEEIYMLRRFHPIFEGRSLKYVIAYATNVTRLKKTELHLAQKEDYLQTLLYSIPDLMLRVSKEGMVMDYKGKGSKKMTAGKTLHELWPDKADFHMERIREAIDNRQIVTYEYDVTSSTGETKTFETRINNNQHFEVVMIVRDITEKKKGEAERERLIKELSDRYSELMQFNYIVSHNLRAPVANILGMADILKLPLQEEEREQTVSYMVQAANSMDALLKDLNVILSTKSPLNERVETFRISAVLETIRENLATQISISGATLHTDIAPDADEMVSIKSYIQSALFNLVSNAIKYRSPERSPEINIKVWRTKNLQHIQISDNGIGLDMGKHSDEIFGLYKRFHTEYEGKGLGLHMTKTQIESMKGTITLTSTPGKGTSFLITIPQ